MAQVQFLKGQSSNLAEQELRDGRLYFTVDTGRFYIDAKNSEGIVDRFLINDNMVFTQTSEAWNNDRELISRKGVIYIYSDYSKSANGRDIPGIKIGDGSAYLIDIPFLDEKIMEHINDKIIHITAEERKFWNNKVSCYLDNNIQDILVFTTN